MKIVQPNPYRFLAALLGIMLLALTLLPVAVNAQITTNLYDSFTGAGTSLNGVVPDVRSGSQTWTAAPVCTEAGVLNGTTGCAMLPVSLTTNKIYTMSMDYTYNGNGSVSGWLGFGFSTVASTATTTSARFSGSTVPGFSWLAYFQNDTIQGFGGPKTAASIFAGAGPFTHGVTHKLTIILNTTGNGSSMTSDFQVDGVSISGGPQTVTLTVSALAYAGFCNYGASSLTGSTVDNFLFTTQDPPTPKMWTGDGGANQWDINTSANWLLGGVGSTVVFADGDQVLFSDPATNPIVNITTVVSPALTTVNAANNYTFTGLGNIAGTNILAKSGTGRLTIATANTYSGGTTISAGTLEANNTSALGSGLVTLSGGILSNSVSLTLANDANISAASAVGVPSATTLTLSGAVGGSGALNKVGAGELILSGANTYSGATTVSNGTLTLSGSRTGSSGLLRAGLDTTLATINISAGTYAMGANPIAVGGGPVGGITNGIINQTGGDITFTSGQALLVGGGGPVNPQSNSGIYNMSGGTISSFTSTVRGVLLGVNDSSHGYFNLSGTGNLNLPTSALELGRADGAFALTNTTGAFYQTGGTATIGTLALGGSGNTCYTNDATLTLMGGTFINSSFLKLAQGNGDTVTMTIGGTADVTLPAFPSAAYGSGSTATLTLDGGTLRPYAASATYMSGLTAAYLTANGGNFNVASGNDITIAQGFEDAPSQAGVLTKSGAGALLLTGVNTYSGGTIINEGTLAATSLGSGNVTVQSGATLSVGDTNTVATLAVGGNLDLDGSTLVFDGGDAITVAGNLTVAGTTTISVPGASPLANGDYILMEVTGTLGGTAANFTVASVSPKTYSIIYQAGTPNKVVLQVSGPIVSQTWAGDGAANQWNIGTGFDWYETGSSMTLITYPDNIPVIFDSSSVNLNVDISTTVSPNSVTINSTNGYTFTGAGGIAGAAALTIGGSATNTLAVANTYSGGTTLLDSGTLILSHSAALGTGPLQLQSTRVGAAPTVCLVGGITVANPIVMDSTTGREAVLVTNGGNTTLSGPITITGSGNNNLYFRQNGNPGSIFTISGGIDAPTHIAGVGLRGSGGNAGVISGPVNIPSSKIQIFGDTSWTIASTGNTWPEARLSQGTGGLILGANDAMPTNALVRWDSDSNGALDMAGFNQTIAGLYCTSTTSNPPPSVGNSSTSSDSLLKIRGAGYTFVGALVDAINAGTRKLSVELLSGTQILKSATNTYTGPTIISGGTLTLQTTASIPNSPVISVASGATFDVSTVTGGFTLGAAQTLTGDGTVVGPATINGTLGVGASVGTLTINNNLTLAGTTLAEVSLDGVGTNDSWIVSGDATYGGSLVVTNIGAAALTNGTVFHLFTVSGAKNLDFTNVTVTPDALAGTFDPTTGDVTLNSTTLPAPGINQVKLSGGNLILQGTNGAAGGSYSILESTNVAFPLASWTTNQTGTFSGSGTFSNAIPIGSDSKKFFRLKQP